ncbi:rhodanese-like domain-containing protein [Psychrobium sp. 1_MG-2023]|uniref:rhodanese-like domain-containing protein n=1 Tax=Psychrobium sp. 1_MG-2023 TaxID=3062624 RepID=UPI000C34DEB4|nr:rhodanese-like domain-containing protein [Psychrobium sp. 1_MG-2023]MDP2560198.1 rhodanese-like domain-containing protein [Psychrobium sp. 1_MG-2023]PKF57009.1 rhodanese-like domain-containing protein [Alteromonadales bacterium alter-6D02]
MKICSSLRLALVVLGLFTTTAAIAHGGSEHTHQTREQQAWTKINHGALLIDVRTAQEYAQGHIKGAINIPFDQAVTLFKQLEVRKNRKVVLYCRSGNRSGKALKALTKQGYTQLHNGGGYQSLLKQHH